MNMTRKELPGQRRENFKMKAARFTRQALQAAGNAALIVAPLKAALPFQNYSSDSDGHQKNTQTIRAQRIAKAGHRNQTSEYSYKKVNSDSLQSRDKKTSIHNIPPSEGHQATLTHGGQILTNQTSTLPNSIISLPQGVQLIGPTDQAITRAQLRQTEEEKRSTFEAEINSIRLLDRMAQMIGLDTAPVTESLLSMAQMKGENVHFLADAKTYLTETLQAEGPRAIAILPPVQLIEMANQLKWNNWGEVIPELQGVSQRAITQARKMGEQFSQLMDSADTTLDDIKDFVEAMGDVFQKHPGLLLGTIFYGSGLYLGIHGAITKNKREALTGSLLFTLACAFNQNIATPLPPNTPGDVLATEPAISEAPGTAVPDLLIPTVPSTPTSADTTGFVDVSTQAGGDVIIDAGISGIGNAYTYSENGQTMIAPTGIELGVEDNAIFTQESATLRSTIRSTGVEPGEIKVFTNGGKGDNNRHTVVAFTEDGKSIIYAQVHQNGEIKYAVYPSSNEFAPEAGVSPDETIRYGGLDLPGDATKETTVIRWIGEQKVLEATTSIGERFVFNHYDGTWISIDRPSTSMSVEGANLIAQTFNLVGVTIPTEQLLEQGTLISKVQDMSGVVHTIAFIHIDPNPEKEGEAMEGNYPFLIKEGNNWRPATLDDISKIFGISSGSLLNLNKDYKEVTFQNFSSGTAFIDWQINQPENGPINFSDSDYNIKTAHSNGINVTGTLIWGQNAPDWVSQENDPNTIMRDYISQTMNHYVGEVDSWIVVNEAGHTGNNGKSDIFFEKLGMQGVRDAFELARGIDPSATLIYNDYVNFDGVGKDDRLPIMKDIITQLKQDGNIDEIGLQVVGRMDSFDTVKLTNTLNELKKFGLPIRITEFSILIEGENSPGNLIRQAQVGAEVMNILKECGCISEVTAWGLEDRLTNIMYSDNANAGFFIEDRKSGNIIPKPIVFEMMKALIKEEP